MKNTVLEFINSTGRGVKKTTSVSSSVEILGELQELVVSAVLELGLKRFTIKEIVSYLSSKNVKTNAARVCEALKRLIARGYVVKLAHGLYHVNREVIAKLLNEAKRLNRDAYTKNKSKPEVKKTDDTREFSSSFGGSLCGGSFVGVFGLDNVRGVRSGRWVGGDRGGMLLFDDLVFFDSVSYSEFRVVLPTSLLEGLGVVVMYNSCCTVGNRRVCGDVVEWRPPKGFVKRFGVVFASRFFKDVVLPRAFASLAYVCRFVLGGNNFNKLFRRLLKGAHGVVVGDALGLVGPPIISV